MIRALLIEAHGLSATREHVAVMGVVIVLWSLLRLLGSCRSRQPRSGCSDDNHISKSMRHKVPPDVAVVTTPTSILNPGIVPGSRYSRDCGCWRFVSSSSARASWPRPF